jgi:hypothetical protein
MHNHELFIGTESQGMEEADQMTRRKAVFKMLQATGGAAASIAFSGSPSSAEAADSSKIYKAKKHYETLQDKGFNVLHYDPSHEGKLLLAPSAVRPSGGMDLYRVRVTKTIATRPTRRKLRNDQFWLPTPLHLSNNRNIVQVPTIFADGQPIAADENAFEADYVYSRPNHNPHLNAMTRFDINEVKAKNLTLVTDTLMLLPQYSSQDILKLQALASRANDGSAQALLAASNLQYNANFKDMSPRCINSREGDCGTKAKVAALRSNSLEVAIGLNIPGTREFEGLHAINYGLLPNGTAYCADAMSNGNVKYYPVGATHIEFQSGSFVELNDPNFPLNNQHIGLNNGAYQAGIQEAGPVSMSISKLDTRKLAPEAVEYAKFHHTNMSQIA